MMSGCYGPYSPHLPWCKAAGVRLDRTETKAPFYSPGSPDCSFPAWGQALLLCLLGEGMAISGLPAQDNAIPVSKSCDHLQAVIYNIFYSATRAF